MMYEQLIILDSIMAYNKIITNNSLLFYSSNLFINYFINKN